MMEEKDVLGRFARLNRKTLGIWIHRGWVTPKRGRKGYQFREIDVARVALIYEFSTELALDEDALGVVLPLLDQVHGLRRQLRLLADAVTAQPEDVRQRIARTLAKTGE